jgi:hypothetical protein
MAGLSLTRPAGSGQRALIVRGTVVRLPEASVATIRSSAVNLSAPRSAARAGFSFSCRSPEPRPRDFSARSTVADPRRASSSFRALAVSRASMLATSSVFTPTLSPLRSVLRLTFLATPLSVTCGPVLSACLAGVGCGSP